MRVYEVEADVKHNLEIEIREYMENNFPNYGEFCILEKEAGLTDDLLFATDREIDLDFYDYEPTDYIMMIERTHFQGHYQRFEIFFFNKDEIEMVEKLQASFNADEIKYMEIEEEEYEDINEGIFNQRDFI
ncbi:hypothetical protein [Peptoniphilus timonensis]|uniref:hypothetical protein n=1 Tax=Peptoniphilus timonensis TaxID=1268254 RepID=UPI0002E223E4|nr:hypothetical protein [Peptoniphilus timonensis]